MEWIRRRAYLEDEKTSDSAKLKKRKQPSRSGLADDDDLFSVYIGLLWLCVLGDFIQGRWARVRASFRLASQALAPSSSTLFPFQNIC